MKKIISFLMISCLMYAGNNAIAQKVPVKVTEVFQGKFPSAKSVEWTDKLTMYEATFEVDGVKYQSTFNTQGEWQSTEKFITENELPAEVKDGLAKSKYNDWEKKSFVWLEKPDKPEQYRIYVEKNALQKKYLYFNKDGQLDKETITL